VAVTEYRQVTFGGGYSAILRPFELPAPEGSRLQVHLVKAKAPAWELYLPGVRLVASAHYGTVSYRTLTFCCGLAVEEEDPLPLEEFLECSCGEAPAPRATALYREAPSAHYAPRSTTPDTFPRTYLGYSYDGVLQERLGLDLFEAAILEEELRGRLRAFASLTVPILRCDGRDRMAALAEVAPLLEATFSHPLSHPIEVELTELLRELEAEIGHG